MWSPPSSWMCLGLIILVQEFFSVSLLEQGGCVVCKVKFSTYGMAKTIYKVILHHRLQCMGAPGTLQLHEHLLPLFLFILDILVEMCMCCGKAECHGVLMEAKTALWSQFSFMWVSGIQPRAPGLQQAPLYTEPSHWPNI